jgi:hypothetical protein
LEGVEGAPQVGPIDFAKDFVLFVSDGDAANCEGLVATVRDDGSRILVRLHDNYYQTIGGFDPVRPFGLFVLPRQNGRTLVIEEDRRRTLDGPPVWTERARFTIPMDPARELDGLRG